jgi:site-specific DNA recombinase
VAEGDVAAALAQFDRVWAVLGPHEQVRLARLLVQQVVFDGRDGSMAITFHQAGHSVALE